MNCYKKFVAYILALLILPLAGCDGQAGSDAVGDPQQGQSGKTPPSFTMEDYTLTPAESEAQLSDLMNGILRGDSYSSAENVGVVDEFFVSEDRPTYAGNYGERSNDTRLLPEGVQRANRAVLANGYIYQAMDGELTILSAQGASSAVVSTTAVASSPEDYENYEETAQAVAVAGTYAAVITYVYAWNMTEGEDGTWASETVSQTRVKFYQVSDPAAPVAVGEFVQDGSYRNAYVANGTLYLITDYYVMNTEAAYLPACGAPGAMEPLALENILVNEQADAAQYTVLSAVALETGTVVDTCALTGLFEPYFIAADTLLLSGWCYAMQQSAPYTENQYQVTDYYSHAITLLAQIACGDGLRLEQAACVNGRLSEAEQMDYDGTYLRLGTMEESYTNRLFADDAMGFSNLEMGEHTFSNEVHVLDSSLQEVGRLTGLSDSSLLYYQRFIGELGYTLSYDQTDSAYTLDLSDPTLPTMGQVISGDAAEILLRCGTRLLGLHADGKLQLMQYDKQALSTVAEADCGNAYEMIRYHLESVLIAPEAGVLVLPGDNVMLLYRFDEAEITAVAEIPVSLSDTTCVLLDGDYLYLTGGADGCSVVQIADGQAVAQVEIAVG